VRRFTFSSFELLCYSGIALFRKDLQCKQSFPLQILFSTGLLMGPVGTAKAAHNDSRAGCKMQMAKVS
jgi:hypothetical protein